VLIASAFPYLEIKARDARLSVLNCRWCGKAMESGIDVIVGRCNTGNELQIGIVHPNCADEMNRIDPFDQATIERPQ
jgi:hypothetical protein